MFVVTSTGVVVVDAPPSIGAKSILEAIASVSTLPVTHFIYSHYHIDHVADNVGLGTNVERISHAETAQVLAERRDPQRPVPTKTFTDSLTLQIG